MNRTVPWSIDAGPDGSRAADMRRSGPGVADRRDEADLVEGPHARGGHVAEMRAIAEQLERLSGSLVRSRGEPDPSRVGTGRLDALRDAVEAISRRQADLDGDGEEAGEVDVPTRDVEPSIEPLPRLHPVPTDADPPAAARPDPAPRGAGAPAHVAVQGPPGLRRAGIDLSAEVTRTFARFSRDLRDAIHAADARPEVEALGRDMRQIGRAVDGLGSGLPDADAIARIGADTRELRDLLKASTARTVPFDGVERQVASLEARLGRLAAMPAPVPPPDLGATMAEVRTLLDGFNPGASMAALEERLDAITDRIERGFDARGPSGLIEGLTRRVDEVHASLRSQLAASAVDTGPLEGLVRGLSDRIGHARDASADFQGLEAAVRAAAAKLDGAAAGLDPRGVQAVEAQIARLSERLERSEASLKALDGVEHTLGELFSQFEVTRQVAIDAAETAARTAARDTLRAALQNPNLAHRSADVPAAVDQMARSLDDIRALQDTAERRTQSALTDIQVAVDRLAQRMALTPPVEQPRRGRAAPEAAEAPRPALDPADFLIEPGAGRGTAAVRPEPRLEIEPDVPAPAPAVEGDGPASFIAAARRAAQAAQASAASAAATKAAERRPAAPRGRPGAAAGEGTLTRARAFLAQRRRPLLLGLAALVALVGALELVELTSDPVGAKRVGEVSAPARTRVASASAPEPTSAADAVAAAAPAGKRADLPVAALPPLAAATPVPLPTFAGGPGKATAPLDGIGEGLRNAAAAGDPAAQYEVGLRYSDGVGVSRDPKQAVAWFTKAAAQGLAPAQYRLGSAYEKGSGVERDPALATSWYGKAADAGNIRAMHNLAVMSAEGAAGKPDYAKAAQWFGKASAYGVRDSQFNLAILYARGLGIEQSLPQSYTWFAIAAAEGDEDAGKKRDEVATKLDPKALASAKAAADAFHAAMPPAAANEVTPPPGGWDAAAPRTPAAKISQL